MKKILAACLMAVAFGAQADLFEDCRTKPLKILFNESQVVEIKRVQFCPRSTPLSEFAVAMLCKRVDDERIACLPYDDDSVARKFKRSDVFGVCLSTAILRNHPAKYMCAEELR